MAAHALPIFSLTADVKMRVASAEKVCAQARERRGHSDAVAALRMRFAAFAINKRFAKVSDSQERLIRSFKEKGKTLESLPLSEIESVASGLDVLIALTRETTQCAQPLAGQWSQHLRQTLSRVSERNGHLESIAESLHMAADPDCGLLLAQAARRVLPA